MNKLFVQKFFVVATIAVGPALSTPATAKTALQCGNEYAAQKAALLAKQVRQADFIRKCRAQQPNRAVAPSPATSRPQGQRKAQAPAATAPGANQFSSEAGAEAGCGSDTVVWVNAKAGIYHFKGDRSFGRTRPGAFMCEQDATAAGHRAAETAKHP